MGGGIGCATVDARALATFHALARLGFGAAFAGAPSRAGSLWVGDRAGQTASRLLLRTTGARDVGIAIGTLMALRGNGSARPWFLASLVADSTDALATLEARHELAPSELWGTVAVAGGAAVLDAVLVAQLD